MKKLQPIPEIASTLKNLPQLTNKSIKSMLRPLTQHFRVMMLQSLILWLT